MQWYETFGSLFEDRDFAALFSAEGQPALSPMKLCLVLLLQFAEGLSDRQAVEAVRTCIDWKYLLCLELTDTGFHRRRAFDIRQARYFGLAKTHLQ